MKPVYREETRSSFDGALAIASRELERVAHGDFGGVKPLYRELLDLQGFECGAFNYNAADGQPANGPIAKAPTATAPTAVAIMATAWKLKDL